MRTISHFLLLIGLFCLFTASTCDRDCQETAAGYDFVLPITLTPAIDTFRVGDTITIASEFSNNVFELNSEQSFFLDSFLFYPTTRIMRIDTTSGYDALDQFEVITITGNEFDIFVSSTDNQLLIGQYEYDGESYKLKFKIIPNTRGTYFFRQFSQLYALDREQAFPGRCKRYPSEGISVLNDNADNNIYLLEDSPDPHFSEWRLEKPMERFYDSGGYAFVVVE